MPQKDVLLILLVQIALILALSRIMGMLFARLRQPQVMGEMVAGILLGPSVLQQVAPNVFAVLFPAESIGYLNILSQIGVVFFLFLVGLELDVNMIRRSGRAAMVISQVSIALPFALGIGLTIYLYGHTSLFENHGPRVELRAAALFMGAAMSITAFPVLARILTERNLHKTSVGAISIACAAVDDASAWCILAFVVAVAQMRGRQDAIETAIFAVAYVTFMLLVMRPALRRLELVYERQGRLSQNVVAAIFLLVLASAYTTEKIGIHALFGAFLMGAIMPKGTQFVRQLSEKLEDYTVVLLLPVFFAFAGLNTRINLLNEPSLWAMTGLIIAVACVGKFGGSAVAARLCGIGWRQASAIGVLMNTRGLMELVILNIGLQLGVITDRVFAMMVIMALVTTAMTTPLLHWVYPFQAFRREGLGAGAGAGGRGAPATKGFSILLPVSLPKSAPPLAQLADIISGPQTAGRKLFALYLRRPVDHEAYHGGLDDEAEARAPEPMAALLVETERRGVPTEPISFVTRDVAADIDAVARDRQVDLVLMGFHKPVLGQAMLGGTVHRVLEVCGTDVAIFVDRGLHSVRKILVPYMGSMHDRLAMELAGRMARSTEAEVTVLHVVPPQRGADGQVLGAKAAVERVFQDPTQPTPVTFRVVEDLSPVDVVLEQARQFDLVVIGVAEEWGLESHLFGWRPERIARDCPSSLLIVRKRAAVPASVDRREQDAAVAERNGPQDGR